MDRREPRWMISTYPLGTPESDTIQVKEHQRDERALLLSEFPYRHRGRIFPFKVFWRLERIPMSMHGRIPLQWDTSN